MIKKLIIAVAIGTIAHTAYAYDADAVSSLLNEAAKSSRGSPAKFRPPNVAMAPADDNQGISRLDAAFDQLLRDCDGRVGVLRSTLAKQTVRAERISIAGGIIGVIGTIATCPHCAALASGLAGLANPMQQTFRDNSDTPQDTRTALKELSDKIRADLEAYQKLPQPITGEKDYEVRLLNRIDALRMANASCHYYDLAAKKADESVTSDKPADGAKTP